MEGYKWHFNETVLTVWSAPNYCYRWVRAAVLWGSGLNWLRCGNVAAIFELDENLKRDYTIFEAAPNVSVCVWEALSLSTYVCCCRRWEESRPRNLFRSTFYDDTAFTKIYCIDTDSQLECDDHSLRSYCFNFFRRKNVYRFVQSQLFVGLLSTTRIHSSFFSVTCAMHYFYYLFFWEC